MALTELPDGDSLSFVGNATMLIRLGPFIVLTDPNFVRKGQWLHIGHGVITRRKLDSARRLGRRGFRSSIGLPTWSSETLTNGDAALTVTASTGPALGSRRRFGST